MARSVSLKLPPSMQTRAAVEPSTFDADKGTVEVVFTTGARGKRSSFWDGPYYEELEVSESAVDMSRLNNGAPVLDAHSSYACSNVIGVVERAWLAGSEGRALLRLSDREEVKPIRADIAAGILRHISVGYSIQKLEKVEEVDDIPVYRATRWTPAEVSFVPMGFDDHATVRGAEKNDFYEVEIATKERDMDQPETPVAPAAPVAPVAQPAPSIAGENRAALEEAAKLTERQRCTDIRSVVTRSKLGSDLADKLIADGASVDEARKVVLNKLADADEKVRTDNHVRVEVGDDEHVKFQRGAVGALIQRAGFANMVRSAQKSETSGGMLLDVALESGEMRGWRLEDFARASLELRGVKLKPVSPDRLFEEALSVRSGMATTSDFSVLLETAMHKVLLASYAVAPETWREFCAVRNVPDFRPANMYRTGMFGVLDKLNQAGEYKNKPIPDGEKASITAEGYGNIIAITRRALVDDDLGAFMNLAATFGASAQATIEAAVYAMIAQNSGLGPTQGDGQPFFHANRKNVGAAAQISVDSLDADAVVLASQKDPANNRTLNLQPAILLVPRSIKGAANVLNDAQFDPSVSNKFQVPNKVNGMFRKVVSTTELTGTRRYSLADPSIAPAFAVAFIDGVETPSMETKAGWRVDGTEIKVSLEFGTAAVDFRGGVTNAGTP